MKAPPAVSHSRGRRARSRAQPGAAAAAARRAGFDVTQATLSRDIKELGLVKRSSDGAYQAAGADRLAADRGCDALVARARRVPAEHRAGAAAGGAQDRAGPGAAAGAGDRSRAAARRGRHLAGDDTILVDLPRRAAARRPRVKRSSGFGGRGRNEIRERHERWLIASWLAICGDRHVTGSRPCAPRRRHCGMDVVAVAFDLGGRTPLSVLRDDALAAGRRSAVTRSTLREDVRARRDRAGAGRRVRPIVARAAVARSLRRTVS